MSREYFWEKWFDADSMLEAVKAGDHGFATLREMIATESAAREVRNAPTGELMAFFPVLGVIAQLAAVVDVKFPDVVEQLEHLIVDELSRRIPIP